MVRLLLSIALALPFCAFSQNDSQDPAFAFPLTPHRPNYILPFAWSSDSGNITQTSNNPDFQLDPVEFHFQLSVRFPIRERFIFQDSPLRFGYTVQSFWQAYNTDVSRPFRETNHEPELMWEIPSSIELLGFENNDNTLILNHQSNGQSGELSRSWNRVMIASEWQRGNLTMVFTPWVKLPHEISPDANFPEDNPDITQYLGNFEWLTVYNRRGHQLSLELRNNMRPENRGSVELRWAIPFPHHSNYKALVTYFNGYGESLIDYKHSQERISIGIQVSDWY